MFRPADLTITTDDSIKVKVSKNPKKYSDLTRELKKKVELESSLEHTEQSSRIKKIEERVNEKSKDWFGLFYGISTLKGYLIPNPLYTYILNIYDLVWFVLMAYQLLQVI